MRIVYFGSGEFGLPTLEALCAAHDVALIVSQPDRPAGRGRQLTPTPVAQFAAERGLPLIKPRRVSAAEVVEQIRAAAADANVVIAFGQKIGDEVIASPRLGRVATMNLHASLLPKYRGAAPIHWAIVRGETVTGNTVFSLVDRMDAGDVLGCYSTPIDPLETTGELHDRLAAAGPDLVLEVLKKLESGSLIPSPQDEAAATTAPKLTRADAVVDFAATSDAIRCRVHGLTPWPSVTVHYTLPGGQPVALKLCRIAAVPHAPAQPGKFLDGGLIATGSGAIQLIHVQPPGKRLMTWEEFNRGHGLPPGTLFS